MLSQKIAPVANNKAANKAAMAPCTENAVLRLHRRPEQAGIEATVLSAQGAERVVVETPPGNSGCERAIRVAWGDMINKHGLAAFSTLAIRSLSVLSMVASMLIAATAGQAADGPVATRDPAPDERPWRVIVSPYVWGASLDGNTVLYGRHARVDVPFSETLKSLDFSFMGDVEITNGTFGAYIDGQYTKTSQKEKVRDNQVGLSITSSLVAGGVYYRIYEQRLGGNNILGRPRVFAVEPTLGLRWTRLKASLDAGIVEVSRQVEWTDPFVGLRLFVDLDERWNIFAEGDIGGFRGGSDLSLNGQIYLGYRTELFTVPTVLRVGYRALYQDYRTNNTPERFEWNVTQHGPVVGLSMRF